MDEQCARVREVTIFWKGVAEPSVFKFDVPVPWCPSYGESLKGKHWTFATADQTHYLDLDSVRHLVLVFASE